MSRTGGIGDVKFKLKPDFKLAASRLSLRTRDFAETTPIVGALTECTVTLLHGALPRDAFKHLTFHGKLGGKGFFGPFVMELSRIALLSFSTSIALLFSPAYGYRKETPAAAARTQPPAVLIRFDFTANIFRRPSAVRSSVLCFRYCHRGAFVRAEISYIALEAYVESEPSRRDNATYFMLQRYDTDAPSTVDLCRRPSAIYDGADDMRPFKYKIWGRLSSGQYRTQA
ncbi:hypothetical protein EVAR_65863_1 [Eumeta japonica]|uniref:Uncharacterized protein n=1 Tax=Eumeta variegata TaxID=151549 RepID=A0A4C1ZIY1_EUMVA|nr:hypothetical protein EVAR_65863_1 [Eumeta japonica]